MCECVRCSLPKRIHNTAQLTMAFGSWLYWDSDILLVPVVNNNNLQFSNFLLMSSINIHTAVDFFFLNETFVFAAHRRIFLCVFLRFSVLIRKWQEGFEHAFSNGTFFFSRMKYSSVLWLTFKLMHQPFQYVFCCRGLNISIHNRFTQKSWGFIQWENWVDYKPIY